MVFPDYDFYVLPKTSFDMKLFRIVNKNHNETYKRMFSLISEIQLPDSSYKWEVLDSSIATVDNKGRLLAQEKLGVTSVRVTDIRATNNKIETRVHVVEPWSINLLISEEEKLDHFWEEWLPFLFRKHKKEHIFDNNWNLIKGNRYYIKAEITDRLNNKVLIPDSAEINWDLPKCVKLISRKNNELVISAEEIEKSAGIVASLGGVKHSQGIYRPKNQVIVDRRITVISKAAIIKPAETILLAYSNITARGSYIDLYGVGGSGSYEWVSKDKKVVTTDIFGKTTAVGVGSTTLELVDRTNGRNKASIEIRVESFAETYFLERRKEILRDSRYKTAVYGTTHMGHRFTSCRGIDFKVAQKELGFMRVTYLRDANLTEYVNELEELAKSNKYLSDQLTQKGTYWNPSKSESLYKAYLTNGELDQKTFYSILNGYSTYGLCGIIQLEGLAPGEIKHSVSIGDTAAGYQTVRVLTGFSNVEPKTQEGMADPNDYLLAFDSTLTWSLTGGPFLWKSTSKTIEKLDINRLDGDGIKAMDAKIILEDLTENGLSNLSLHCQKNNLFQRAHYKVTFTRQNQADEDLILPLAVSTNLQVVCAIPDILELFEVDESRPLFTHTNIRADYFKPHTLRNNKPYHLQAWMFDAHYKPFYNFSSLWFEWQSNNKKMADFENIRDHREQAELKVGSEVGKVTLVVSTDTYKIGHTKTEFKAIRKEYTVDVMNTVFVEPSHKLLYNSKNASFEISVNKGSGNFRITTNTSAVVELVVSNNKRSIRVSPKAIGDCLVTVEDLQLPNSPKATCEIYVRNAYSVQLSIPHSLAVTESQVGARVTVTDHSKLVFDHDQVHFMKISLSTDSAASVHENPLTIKRASSNEFLLQGHAAAIYNLVALLDTSTGSVASNYETLEVFNPIRTIPHEIINAPGCISTVKVTGGPSHQAYTNYNLTLKSNLISSRVCKVTKHQKKFFEIESLVIGRDQIDFTLVDSTGRVLTSTTLAVLVDHIEEYRVLNMDKRRIHVDAPVRLISHGIIAGKVMTPSYCGFRYKWHVANEDVLTLGGIDDFGMQTGGDVTSLLAVNATGRREGTAKIELEVDQPHSLFSTKVYTTTLTVQVIQPVNVMSPTYVFHDFGSNNHFILPPNSFYKVTTTLPHHSLDFRLMHSSSPGNVQVSPRGGIRIGGSRGEGVVVISDNTNPDQISYVNIRVVDIYSILVENSYKTNMMPLGSEIKLKVDLQNENGFLFPQPLEGVNLVAVSTNLGVVSLGFDDSQSNIIITALSAGSTYVILYLESNPAVYDIFRVEVGSVVVPSGNVKVHKGGQVHFTLTNSKISRDRIVWSTDNLKVLDIDSHSGLAAARSVGNANVILKDLGQYTTPVTVYEIDSITQSAESDRRMTSNPKSVHYKSKYELVFDAQSNKATVHHFNDNTGGIDNGLTFKCQTSASSIFHLEPTIKSDPVSGVQKLVCAVSLVPHFHDQGLYPDRFIVRTTLESGDKSFSLSSETPVFFEWGFVASPVQAVDFCLLRFRWVREGGRTNFKCIVQGHWILSSMLT